MAPSAILYDTFWVVDPLMSQKRKSDFVLRCQGLCLNLIFLSPPLTRSSSYGEMYHENRPTASNKKDKTICRNVMVSYAFINTFRLNPGGN